MAGKLAGKVAIITGAGSGQGAAMTKLFIKEGAKVVMADLNEAGMKEVSADLTLTRFAPILCEVSNDDQVERSRGDRGSRVRRRGRALQRRGNRR